jgi:hypothetical protein
MLGEGIMKLEEVESIEVLISDGKHERLAAFLDPAKVRDLLNEDSSLGDFLRAIVAAEPMPRVPGAQ